MAEENNSVSKYITDCSYTRNMKYSPRLIDANKLNEDISSEYRSDYYGYNLHLDELQGIVNRQPTINPIEIVRCQDCKYRDRERERSNDEWVCTKYEMDFIDVNPDFYCAFGEKYEKSDFLNNN